VNSKTKCFTASKNTSYEWVVQDTNTVKIIWPDRFINTRHKNNRWLNQVNTYAPEGVSLYEDLYGNRTNVAIKNVHGKYVEVCSAKIIYDSRYELVNQQGVLISQMTEDLKKLSQPSYLLYSIK
jgi:hypothetical protein